MQLISAVVRPSKVDAVCEALQAFGFRGLTLTEVSGFGKRRRHPEVYRGAQYSSAFQQKVKIEIVVPDEEVQDLVDVICRAASTGASGDGKVWVTQVSMLVRIRNRQAGSAAL